MARIIFSNRYFHPDESATAQMLTDLAQELARENEVWVLCCRQRLEDPLAGLPARGVLANVRIRRLWSTRYGRSHLLGRACDYLSFLASVLAWLAINLRHRDVVIAKTDPPLLGVVCAIAALGRRVSLVHWLQDLYPETAWGLGVTRANTLAGRLIRSLRNWSLHRAQLTVVVSPGAVDYLRQEAGLGSVRFIPNWAANVSAPGAPSSYRLEMGLNDKFVIGYSGNLGRAHPIGALCRLAEELRSDRECHFLFSGSGANFHALRMHIEGLGVKNWSFLPYQPRERLADLLTASDVHLVLLDPRLERFVFPSKIYGILSAGRPILHLGDPAGEVARLTQEQRCGWSLAESDAGGAAALIRRLRHDRQELDRVAKQSRLAYEAAFSGPAAFERWQSALTPILR